MCGRTRIRRLDLQGDVRMGGRVVRESRHEQLTREERRELYPQTRATSAARGLREAAVERVEQWLHLFEERVARSGELERARLALEEAQAEQRFELLDLMTHRRRREKEFVGGHL